MIRLIENTKKQEKKFVDYFEKDLFELINAYAKIGLKKPDLVHKMKYVTKMCELS